MMTNSVDDKQTSGHMVCRAASGALDGPEIKQWFKTRIIRGPKEGPEMFHPCNPQKRASKESADGWIPGDNNGSIKLERNGLVMAGSCGAATA